MRDGCIEIRNWFQLRSFRRGACICSVGRTASTGAGLLKARSLTSVENL